MEFKIGTQFHTRTGEKRVVTGLRQVNGDVSVIQKAWGQDFADPNKRNRWFPGVETLASYLADFVQKKEG